MVDLGILPDDTALIAGLLHPLDRAVARAGHGAGISARPGARGNQHRIVAAPGGVFRAAVIERADVDVNCGSGRLIAHHRGAERGVERHRLMRHGNQFRRRQASFVRFRDALLPKGDLRTGNEK